MSAYGDLASPKPTGLAALVRQMEAEHADEAAQAHVEGRPRRSVWFYGAVVLDAPGVYESVAVGTESVGQAVRYVSPLWDADRGVYRLP